tara:strand:- start:605 stop:1405 length:801 start_codon:yes stop_codon:yes gene_type:complete
MIVRAREIKNDTRFEYYAELVRELMNATIDSHGPYEWQPWDQEISPDRQKEMLRIGQSLNIIYSARRPEFDSVAIPVKQHVRKGINGYRLLLIRKKDQERFKNIKSIDGLKNLTVGQARGWPDVGVFQENNFKISDSGSYAQLIPMLKARRFDYYALGISEAPQVLQDCGSNCKNIMIEETILLHYPFPIFLYVSKNTPALAERLEYGMEQLLKNGKFDDLWQRYHNEYLINLNISKRKVFKLSNKNIPAFTMTDRPELWLNLTKH